MVTSTNTSDSLKKYFAIACVFIVAVALFLFVRSLQRQTSSAYELLRKQKEEHERLTSEIIRITNEEKEKLINLQKETELKLQDEHKRYDELKRQIESKKKKKIEDIIEEHGQDPDALANLMATHFGLTR